MTGRDWVARFWSKVQKSDGCWLWTGPVKSRAHPYGRFWVSPERKHVKAHRIAWELEHGTIPEKLHVLHRCDNPRCVRPDHLWLGTHRQNMQDMAAKGRAAIVRSGEAWWRVHAAHVEAKTGRRQTKTENYRRGEDTHQAKLTEKEVLQLRQQWALRAGEKGLSEALARERGLVRQTVWQIVTRRTWRHVGDQP